LQGFAVVAKLTSESENRSPPRIVEGVQLPYLKNGAVHRYCTHPLGIVCTYAYRTDHHRNSPTSSFSEQTLPRQLNSLKGI